MTKSKPCQHLLLYQRRQQTAGSIGKKIKRIDSATEHIQPHILKQFHRGREQKDDQCFDPPRSRPGQPVFEQAEHEDQPKRLNGVGEVTGVQSKDQAPQSNSTVSITRSTSGAGHIPRADLPVTMPQCGT